VSLSPGSAATMSAVKSRNSVRPTARCGDAQSASDRALQGTDAKGYGAFVGFPEDILPDDIAAPGRRRSDDAKNAGFEAKAPEGNRTGGRSCRRVFDAGRWCIRSRNHGTARGYTVSGHRTGSHDHAHRGGNLRRQLGDVLRLRQGSPPARRTRRTICPETRWLPRRRWLPWRRLPRGLRRQRLQRLRHRLHRRLRRLQL
jgi:hypothetical protein